MQRAAHRILPDGRRLHLHHGPIDIVAEAFGPQAAVAMAYARAVARFETVLDELVAELPLLRRPVVGGDAPVTGETARIMWCAAARFRPAFVTPMAGVAGAVAETVLAATTADPAIARAYVNDGGDIALHLAPEAEPLGAHIAVDPAAPRSPGDLVVAAGSPIRGIATSGRHGRSHSLGIADSVTVVASSAAVADVAATLVANAVDLPGHPAVRRAPASTLSPDSDLGERLVTVGVGPLSSKEVESALDAGERMADDYVAAGLIAGALVVLGGVVRVVGHPPLRWIDNEKTNRGMPPWPRSPSARTS
ncbi:UPF0280 family protein [Salinarimonas rosea]|uniref:UPF0280 family protein n=1 Tax=Salinarimonas rosea TaxID=552063 RepID=UPI00040CB1CE|nr:UPF0280 family protein [Salinarimonas rosea]